MYKLPTLLSLLLFLTFGACDDSTTSANDEFTGRAISYDLVKASDFDISGTVTFRERKDLSIQIEVLLSGTEGEVTHPVHLHYGDLSVPDAEIAVLLNDLLGSTGESSTIVDQLSDESKFTFERAKDFKGCVKIHLSAFGEGRDVVLAAGNIGTAFTKSGVTGRTKVAVCGSEED